MHSQSNPAPPSSHPHPCPPLHHPPSPAIPLAPPLPSTSPTPHNVRQTSIRRDLYKAFKLLRRSQKAKRFMLAPADPHYDLNILAGNQARPSFTIATDEVQLGKLPGHIALRYLGIPSFSNVDGLSGGLIVTTYAKRTHPLHSPQLLSDLRLGHYLRDNRTGDWCIITRNHSDGILRLQYINVNHFGVVRERIGLTCSTALFDAGHFIQSVLYKCHDYEYKVNSPDPGPVPSAPDPVLPFGLHSVAHKVLAEGAHQWFGKVRVTVVSNFTKNPNCNVDDTMTVRSSYQPTMDKQLANHMRRLAILETISNSAIVPPPMFLPQPADDTIIKDENETQSHQYNQQSHIDDLTALLMPAGVVNDLPQHDTQTENQMHIHPPSPETAKSAHQLQQKGQEHIEDDHDDDTIPLSPMLRPQNSPSPCPSPLASLLDTPPLAIVAKSPHQNFSAGSSPIRKLFADKDVSFEPSTSMHPGTFTKRENEIAPTNCGSNISSANNNFIPNSNDSNNNNSTNSPQQPAPSSMVPDEAMKHKLSSSPTPSPFENLTFDDLFLPADEGLEETANHFLIPNTAHNMASSVGGFKAYTELSGDLGDFPMLPADPSTLPGGIEACMDGMDVEEESYYDDDCFSLMTSERDTRSMTSALSTAGSDYAPKVDSVPQPGDDVVVDGLSALNLSSSHQHDFVKAHDSSKNVGQGQHSLHHHHHLQQSQNAESFTIDSIGKAKGWLEHQMRASADSQPADHDQDTSAKELSIELEPINAPMSAKSRASLAKGQSVTNLSEMDDSSTSDDRMSAKMECVEESHSSSTSVDIGISNSDLKQSHQNTSTQQQVKTAATQPESQTETPVALSDRNLEPLAEQHKKSQQEEQPWQQTVKSEPAKVQTAANYIPMHVPGTSAMFPAGFSMAHPMYTSFPPGTPGAPMVAVPMAGGGAVVVPQPLMADTGGNMVHNMATAATMMPAPGGMWMFPPNNASVAASATPTTPTTNTNCNNSISGNVTMMNGMVMMPPKLAPRPAGVGMGVGAGMYGDTRLMLAIEKERKAEERRKKNRQAAARSNARKKDLMDGIKSEIQKSKRQEDALRKRQANLKKQNAVLRQQLQLRMN